jgi:hypothetical protein
MGCATCGVGELGGEFEREGVVSDNKRGVCLFIYREGSGEVSEMICEVIKCDVRNEG